MIYIYATAIMPFKQNENIGCYFCWNWTLGARGL